VSLTSFLAHSLRATPRVILCFAIALGPRLIFAQEAVEPCECRFSGLYNEEGWQVPGLIGATEAAPRARLRVNGADSPVFVTKLKPGGTGFLTSVSCGQDVPGALTVRTRAVEALQLWRADINGKVFAYDVVAGYITTPDELGKYRSVGTSWEVAFYDVDGRGRFRVMKHSPHQFAFDTPPWVKVPPLH
jgi:hypothetical protein